MSTDTPPPRLCVFCIKVMLGGKNIEEGFGIAYRVVQVRLYESRSFSPAPKSVFDQAVLRSLCFFSLPICLCVLFRNFS